MTATVIGSQLGDEGKGGIVDLLGDEADLVVRYQGGDNAGHTVQTGGEEYKLSLIPSGCVRGRTGVLGNGCVVNLRTLFEELDTLQERGLDPDVRIAERAHVILPLHRELDGMEEAAKSDAQTEIGTTGRGIGPTYEDKAARRGVRVGDLLDPDVLRERLEYLIPYRRSLAEEVYGVDTGEAFDVDATYAELRRYGDRLREADMTVNAGTHLSERVAEGEEILLEGAQGTCLDIDHGDFPFVTSSNPTAGYAATGTGLPPAVIGDGAIVGVVKGYLSRVGSGPLPTELTGDIAESIRERGGEYGTVTGRPRRVGWLDLPMLRHAAEVSGFTDLAVNHLDVLAAFDEIEVAVAYELDGERLTSLPATDARWARCEPVYRSLSGWPDVEWASVAADGWAALPESAKEFIGFIEDSVGVPVSIVGVGPDRSAAVVRNHPLRD
jgi:adenylosuccinate synthase